MAYQPQFEYFKIPTIVSKYAKSTSKFQSYLVFELSQFSKILTN
jgi:hypothetical protein